MAENDYEEKVEESTTSKINSGMLIILRLNDLWKDSHRHARDGKYSKWNDDLDRVWCELAGDAKPAKKGEKTVDEKYDELTLIFADSCKDMPEVTGFEKHGEDSKALFAKQKQALIKKEVFLRKLQNDQGKGTAYHDSSEDYMD